MIEQEKQYAMRYANNRDRLHTTLRTITVCAGVLLLGWSCQRRPDPAPGLLEDMALDVAPSFASLEGPSNSAPNSKATLLDKFTAGDKVGLYLVYCNNSGASRPLSDVHADSANLRYTASAAGMLTRILPDKPVFYNKLNSNKVDLYAYFPYNEAMNTAQLAAYKFTVKQDQSVVGAMAASDLCWAKNEKGLESTSIVPSAKPVEMHFKHKFAKITLTIKTPKSLSDNRTVTGLKNIRFLGVVSSAVLNVSTGVATLATGEQPISITPRAGTPTTSDADWNTYPFELIVPAQTMTANVAVVNFQVETSGKSEEFTLYAPGDLFGTHGLTSQAGIQYDMSITVGSNSGGGGGGADGGQIEVKLEGSSIKAWVAGPSVAGDLTNSITTKFSFTHAAITSAVNRVKVTTNESATVYEITTGVAVAGTTCSFAFTRASSSPRDYGFSITKMEFLNGTTTVHTWTGTSDRVYNPTSMTL